MNNSDNFQLKSGISAVKTSRLTIIALIFSLLFVSVICPVSAASTSEGTAFLKAGEYQKAVDWFESTLQSAKEADRYLLLNNLGAAYLALGKYDDAKKNFDEAVKANTSYGLAWINLGTVNERINNTNEAINAYDEAIKVDSSHAATAQMRKGSLLTRTGKYEDALSAFKLAEPDAKKSEKLDLYTGIGAVYLLLKDYPNAEKALNQAIEIDPANASMAYYNLGVLKTSEKKYDEAKEALEQSLKINPSLKLATQALEKLDKIIANSTSTKS